MTLYNQVQEVPVVPVGTILDFSKEPRSRTEIAAFLCLKTASYAIERHIRSMLEDGKLETIYSEDSYADLNDARSSHYIKDAKVIIKKKSFHIKQNSWTSAKDVQLSVIMILLANNTGTI